MKLETLQYNLEKVVKQRNFSRIISIIMVISNLILVVSLGIKDTTTIIIPSSLKQTVWLSNSEVSKEYLEEMAIFIASLMLDVSADSAEYKREVILRHVSSNFHNALDKKLIQEQEKMLKEQFSTSFKPIEAQVNDKELQVQITGELITFVGGKNVKQIRVSYLMKFEYTLGNLLLKSFISEVS